MGNSGLAEFLQRPLVKPSTLPPLNSFFELNTYTGTPCRRLFLNNGFRLVLELSFETAPNTPSSSPSVVRYPPRNECLPLVCNSICPAS